MPVNISRKIKMNWNIKFVLVTFPYKNDIWYFLSEYLYASTWKNMVKNAKDHKKAEKLLPLSKALLFNTHCIKNVAFHEGFLQ